MKKILAILLAALMLFGLCGCAEKSAYSDLTIMADVKLSDQELYGIAFRHGSDMTAKVDGIITNLFANGEIKKIAKTYGIEDNLPAEYKPSTDATVEGDSDYDSIKKTGKLVIGITNFAPMDYLNDKNEWVGFDADLARKVCAELGVTPEFKEIVWGNKEIELKTKSIDCVWNGMTITDAMLEAADVTGGYMTNYQVIVVKDAKTFKTPADLKGKTVVAEGGSAGEAAALANENLKDGFKPVDSQADALLQVKSGAADACVIDLLMASAMISGIVKVEE